MLHKERQDRPPVVGGIRGLICVALGCCCVGLGVLGALLPVLPTTPFLLLASFLFVRSSPWLNERLLRSPLFGPFLRDWYEHRGVRPRVKVTAVVVLIVAVSGSVYWGNLSWPLLTGLLVLAAIGLTVVLRLPLVRAVPAEVVGDISQRRPGQDGRRCEMSLTARNAD